MRSTRAAAQAAERLVEVLSDDDAPSRPYREGIVDSGTAVELGRPAEPTVTALPSSGLDARERCAARERN